MKRQGAEVEECIANGYTLEQAKEHFDDIVPFWGMVEEMRKKGQSLEDYLGNVCQNILKDVAVFKDNNVGEAGFDRFVEACGL